VIEISAHPEGAVLAVRAQAGARRDEIRGEQDGALKVAVTQAPEKGKANKAIIATLAKHLGVRKSQIELLSGATSPHKRFLIRGIDVKTLSDRVTQS
jgi:uncharacterized protein (TIGR00251 family)